MFSGVDAVIFTHVADNLAVSWGQPMGTGLVSVEYTFQGEAAHSAMAPWRGRSALDAVELMNMGWDKRREHLRPAQRSHYVITDGGDQPNVVPSVASVWYYFREQTFEGIEKNYGIGNKIAEAAAAMTDTTVTRRVRGAAAPQHFNKPMAEAAERNIQAVGLPAWTADEQAFAKAVQKNLGAKEEGSRDQARGPQGAGPRAAQRRLGRHRRCLVDCADDRRALSVEHPRPAGPPLGQCDRDGDADRAQGRRRGLEGRGDDDARPAGQRETAAQRAGDYFTNVQTKDQKYVPVLGAEDRPTIEMNADTMGSLSRPAQEVLLRPEPVRHVSRPARHQVSDADQRVRRRLTDC